MAAAAGLRLSGRALSRTLQPPATSAAHPAPTHNPRSTLGQELRFTRYLWYARPALSIGFSVRPPPDTWPSVARHSLLITCGRVTRGAVKEGGGRGAHPGGRCGE